MKSFAGQTLSDFLASIASKTPTPGGGAVASAVGALGAALAQMVVSYSVGKKSLAQHQPELEKAAHTFENARAVLLRLADEDAAAYGLVNELSRLPETDERRIRELPAANEASVQVPLAVAATCVDLLRLFERLAPMTNPQLRSDLAIAAVLAEATARSSRWNVAVNTAFLPEPNRLKPQATMTALLTDAARLLASVEQKCA